MNTVIVLTILLLCLMNLARMATYLVSSDAYTIKNLMTAKRRSRWHFPTVAVLVPAHNEGVAIERNLLSLYNSNYPAGKLEVIVVNDGSTDDTKQVIQNFIKNHNDRCTFRLVNRPNKGKAGALNYALKNCVRSQMVMCLDADSHLEPAAISNAMQHFRDRKVVALSSNVNIIEDGSLLALVQKFEYLVCYQMKRGQALLNMEYIVGGIGSAFRYSMLKKVSFYDSNTMTEDIDLTMKIIVNGTKGQKIAYAADSIAHTEPAYTVAELLKQRYRWKYGRSQTFLKNTRIFFSRDKKYLKRLTWFALPYALFQDLLFFFEPLIIGYFIYLTLRYGDTQTISSAMIVLSAYLLVNVWSSDHLSVKERLRLTYYAPPMYFLMFVLSYVEYYALIKALILSPRLKNSISSGDTTWLSPARKHAAINR